MASVIERLASRLGFERRGAESPSWAALRAGDIGGEAVTPQTAENIAGVLACVMAIATGVATLPAYVYRRQGASREEVTDHPLCEMIRRGPNATQTWPDFLQALVASGVMHGNGLARVLPNGELQFIPWAWVRPLLLETGRIAYDVTEGGGLLSGAPTRSYRLLQDEVIHLRDLSDDGRIGRSRLQRSNLTFQLAHEASRTALAIYRNGNRLGGVLEVDEWAPDQSAVERLRADWEVAHTGSLNAGRTPILQGGLKFKPIAATPEDAELLDSRKFALEDICRVYGVPPPLVQDLSHGTFTNSREAARWFCQFTLTPWIRKIEAEFARTYFPAGSGLELELDMSGLLRADPESRWISHKTAVEAGILDADEIREIEGYDPRPAAPAAPAAAPIPPAVMV
ncbi:MAG: phage portal protein [Sphingomonadales bacterium 32-65-25]|nr:MAG: phage portal protein [Sphingomonadales bacterium 32-65-25]